MLVKYDLNIMFSLIDTHAHLDEMENLEIAVQTAQESGVRNIIAVGSSPDSNHKILELSRQHPSFIYPALGLHPWELHKLTREQISQAIQSIEDNINEIKAIGEIGLDYDKRVLKLTTKEQQKDTLNLLLKLAKKYDKPVSIHSRYAWKDCFDIIRDAGVNKVVFHWFTGSSSVLRNILDAGYYVSATPAAEYHEEHRQAIKDTPLSRLLLETDCPVRYGREVKYRSQPSDVLRSLNAIAALKEIDVAEIASHTTDNAIRLFQL
jgi:TatD DNase family protein